MIHSAVARWYKTKRWPSCQTCWDLLLPGGAVSLLRILEGLILFGKRHHLTISDQKQSLSACVDSSWRDQSFTSLLAVQKQFRNCCLLKCEDQLRISVCHVIWIWLLTLPKRDETNCASNHGLHHRQNMILCIQHVGANEPTEKCVLFSWGIKKGLPKPSLTSGTHHKCKYDIYHHIDYFVICCVQVSHRFLKCLLLRYSLVFPPNPHKQTPGLHFFTLPLVGHSKLCLWWNQWGNVSHVNYCEQVALPLPYLGSIKDCSTAQTTWRILFMYDNHWSQKKSNRLEVIYPGSKVPGNTSENASGHSPW